MRPSIQGVSNQRMWNSLYKKAQQGSFSAVEKLFELVDPEIKQMVRTYSPRFCFRQDLYAEGCETYMNLVSNQKRPVKKAKNYILKYIRMQMKQMRDKIRQKDRNFISVDDFKFSEEERKKSLAKTFGYRGWTQPRQENMLIVKEILDYISRLPEKTQKVLTEVLINGNSGAVTAEKVGISADNVFQIVSRERKLLREWVNR